jgi:zinc transport system substrate-binding protein
LHTPKREFLTAHTAFYYLADQYHLNQIAIAGLSPDDEPSPKEVSKLVELLQKHQVKIVFFETLANNKLADTIKNEIHAQAEVLNPLEGLSNQEIANKEDYFSVMMKNLSNLKKALGGANE